MADVFSSAPGIVAAFVDEKIVPGQIKLQGFNPQAALISGVDFDQAAQIQFQHSLDHKIYLYVFGDRMGNITVAGKCFPQLCDTDAQGLTEVFEFYAANRASVKPEPITVTIGSKTITGYLTALKIRGVNLAEDPTALTQDYWLNISSLPG